MIAHPNSDSSRVPAPPAASDATGVVRSLEPRLRIGDREAAEHFIALVFDELRSLAEVQLRIKGGRTGTFGGSDLVQEALIKLGPDLDFESKRHFFGAAARAMQQVLVDRARRRAAVRHGGGRNRMDLDKEAEVLSRELPETLPSDERLALSEAITALERSAPELAEAFLLRHYPGLTYSQIGLVTSVSERTARERVARALVQLRTLMENPS